MAASLTPLRVWMISLPVPFARSHPLGTCCRLVLAALLGAFTATASAAPLVTISSASVDPGATVTLSIAVGSSAANVAGLDLALQVSAPIGAPDLAKPALAAGAATSGWSSFDAGDPLRTVQYTATGVAGPAELAKLTVTVDPSAPRGTVYTVSARQAVVTDDAGVVQKGAGLVASGRITVRPDPLTQPPTAADDAWDAPKDGVLTVPAPGVLANDTDTLGRPLIAQIVTGPAHGSVALAANGSFRYVPADGFTGTDTFTYAAANGRTTSDPATVTLSVRPRPAAPGLSVTVPQNGTVAFRLPGSSFNGAMLTAEVRLAPLHGDLSGSGLDRVYTPDPNYAGPDAFSYAVTDGLGESRPGVVTIAVVGPSAAVVVSSAIANPGDTVTLSIAIPAGTGQATGLDLTLQPSGPSGAPPLDQMTYTAGADTAGWSTFDAGDPTRTVRYSATPVASPAELARVSFHISPSTPRGSVYKIVATGLSLVDDQGAVTRGGYRVTTGRITLPGIPGDLNGDGVVDARDVQALLQIFLGLRPASPAELTAGDARPKPGRLGHAYGDGQIGSDDLNWLMRRFLGLETGP